MKSYDVVVIGTGAAGSSAAYACRKAEWSVAIADYRPFGGTCALRGCDPKKVLFAAEELVDWSQRFEERNVVHGNMQIDWPALTRFKDTFTEPVPATNDEAFAAAGIATYNARASFVDASTLRLGDDTVNARHVVISSGAEPVRLGFDGEQFLTKSEQFLDLKELPKRLVMVGGGYISFEFAHIAARAGSAVTIIHQGERPLEQFDADLVSSLVEATRAIGIDIRLKTTVKRIERHDDGLVVYMEDGDGNSAAIDTALAVHGAGRAPDLELLSLQSAGVASTSRGITVNEYLQSTSTPHVYAAGDAADTSYPRLTPVAGLEGEIVAANLLKNNSRKAELGAVPSIVYTSPSLGAVGLTQQQAGEQGRQFTVKSGDSTDWYSSRRIAARASKYKLLIENGTDRILGASILGPGAEELTNIFTMAIRLNVAAARLRDVVFAYPTFASDITYML
ncbi:MAG: NAD(P)/FAD-dependent oxidoreductase [Candidatus Velthaea sp.]